MCRRLSPPRGRPVYLPCQQDTCRGFQLCRWRFTVTLIGQSSRHRLWRSVSCSVKTPRLIGRSVRGRWRRARRFCCRRHASRPGRRDDLVPRVVFHEALTAPSRRRTTNQLLFPFRCSSSEGLFEFRVIRRDCVLTLILVSSLTLRQKFQLR